MKWLRWLLGDNTAKTVGKEDKSCCDVKETECCDPIIEEKVEGFVDEETGKVYKTAGALKGAQTRRRNKKAKAKK